MKGLVRLVGWIVMAAWLCAASLSIAQHGVAPALRVQVQAADQQRAAPAADGWSDARLPSSTSGPAWYRITFEVPRDRSGAWAVYLPYFYAGGSLLLNGAPLGQVTTADSSRVVRWERPFLFTIPDSQLHPGANVLLIHAPTSAVVPQARLPALSVGPQDRLLVDYERRRFWQTTMPQFTVIACLVVGVLVLFIWWRRREELLYGLFGVAAILWGFRTLTFVIETLPASAWPLWRLLYHCATGGFVIALTIFALRLSQTVRPRVEQALLAYWLLGPVAFVVSGGSEHILGRLWAGGLIPIGLAMVVATLVAAFRRRIWDTVALALAISLAVMTGVHDYLMVISASLLQTLAPGWAGQRIFMLHYGANLVLLVMGSILALRFVAALQAVEQLNRTLESRVEERERALADNYDRLARLERQHAADEERQRIMRDLHDGLGSQLFVTLSRVETGQLAGDGVAESLRECIADMRLALEASSPDGDNFLQAWGDFRFRWTRQLENAGVASRWRTEPPDAGIRLSPHIGLQLLRIAQETLTNILKHAKARQVQVALVAEEGKVILDIADDGVGMGAVPGNGRGLANIRARVARLGAQLGVSPATPGTRVRVALPVAGPAQDTANLQLPAARLEPGVRLSPATTTWRRDGNTSGSRQKPSNVPAGQVQTDDDGVAKSRR